MPKTIKFSLDTSRYATPTQEDVSAAKRYILMREEYARVLEGRIDDLLADAAERIVIICYRHKVDPKLLYFSSAFNEEMMNEIEKVMDELEEAILDLVNEYSTRSTNDKERTNALLLWLATLGKGNKNLQETLDGYLYKTMKDWEAAVAALLHAGVKQSDAVTKIKAHLHSIYTMPEVLAAFKRSGEFAATYIRSRGVTKGGMGLSNNGSTNVTSMAKTTLQMAWMREQREEMAENENVTGYYVQRGSNYPCALCDSMVGFHPISDMDGYPPFHPNCCCFVIPIYNKEKI